MEPTTIEMDVAEAREKYDEYRKAVKERYGSLAAATAADQAVVRSYRELAKGNPVMDIVKVLQEAGLDSEGRPLLAICRADAKWVRCNVSPNGAARFEQDDGEYPAWRRPGFSKRRDVLVAEGTFDDASWVSNIRAMVPEVPLHLRPASMLGNYHILWEAEWTAAPPGDPILLRRIGGDLYAVLAQWDLTPIEQAILRGLRL